MRTREPNPEKVESEVPKGKSTALVCGLQHCERDNTLQQDQNDESLCTNSGRDSCQEQDILCPVVEGDCKSRSFSYHHQNTVDAYSDIETTVSNPYACEERTNNPCKQEEITSDQDIKYKSGGYNSHQNQEEYFVCPEEHTYQRRNSAIPRKEGEAYRNIETTVSNSYSFEERTNNPCKLKEMTSDQDINYDSGSYHCHQNQEEYFVCSEEHTYQRKYCTKPMKDSHLNRDYDYCSRDDIYQTDESSTFPYDSHVNTNHLHSKSPSYIQMSNVPFDDQEPYQQRGNEFLEDNTSTNQRCREVYPNPDRQVETCVVREYIYEGSDCVLQEKSDYNVDRASCHNKYDTFNYESQNRNEYQDEVIDSTIQQQCEDQSCNYEPHDDRLYPKGEPPSVEHGNYQIRSCSYLEKNSSTENKSYLINKIPHKETFINEDSLQRKHSPTTKKNHYLCEEKGSFQKNETSAVDLRICRPLTHPLSPPSIGENQNTNLLNPSYITPDLMGYEEDNKNHLEPPELDESFDYNVCETMEVENNNLWDAATNTDHATFENKESQTMCTEVREVAVQTDTENKIIPFALFKNIQEEIVKHTCPVCQRVYISKSSFDRHLKTHEKGKTVITNVRFTTEAKLQICKRSGKNKHLNNKTPKPIIIKVPRSIFKCDTCEKIFPNQREKDSHVCTPNPFTLTKCPECHIKFYTSGALNEHIEVIHKKENAYYCIFCNKSFSAGYNFHLHLDEHLSAQ